MDDITTRTVVIAVNILVTIAIVSLVIVMFFQMKEIYGVVAKTDTSIYNKFDDVYSMYNGKVVTGIGLLNTLKKYEDEIDSEVEIRYDGYETLRESVSGVGNEKSREVEKLKELMEQGDGYNYEDKYSVTVYDGEDQTIIIEFKRTVEAK